MLLLLLVKLLQRNPSLTQGLLRGIEITELMSMLLFIMYEDTAGWHPGGGYVGSE